MNEVIQNWWKEVGWKNMTIRQRVNFIAASAIVWPLFGLMLFWVFPILVWKLVLGTIGVALSTVENVLTSFQDIRFLLFMILVVLVGVLIVLYRLLRAVRNG